MVRSSSKIGVLIMNRTEKRKTVHLAAASDTIESNEWAAIFLSVPRPNLFTNIVTDEC